MHYYGLVDIKDNLLGKDGEIKLYKDRNIALNDLEEYKKKKGNDHYFLASFKLMHQVSYGKILTNA